MPIPSQQAVGQAVSLYSGANPNPRDFGSPSVLQKWADMAAAGEMDVSYFASCSGQVAPKLNAFQTDSGMALGTVAAGVGILGQAGKIAAASIPVIGSVIAGVSLLVSFVSAIFAHHAAAVRRDESFTCSAIPAVNNAFAVLKQAVQSGQTTPAAASAALDAIYAQFMSAGGAGSSPSSIPSSGTAINKSPYCNSNCEASVVVKAMVLYWQSQFNSIRTSGQLIGSPAGYSATGSVAVLSPLLATAGVSPTLAKTLSPSAGYGALIVVLVAVAILLSARKGKEA